jgi:hypothetical protein
MWDCSTPFGNQVIFRDSRGVGKNKLSQDVPRIFMVESTSPRQWMPHDQDLERLRVEVLRKLGEQVQQPIGQQPHQQFSKVQQH